MPIGHSPSSDIDTGSKPFRCGICDRGFSRGDVLNRHVKGHKQSARIESPVGGDVLSTQRDTISSSTQAPHIPSASLIAARPTAELHQGDEHHLASEDHMRWSTQMAFLPGTHEPQPELSSSLLWPDSENLFLSLTDGALWDHSMPGMVSQQHAPHCGSRPAATPPAAMDLSPYDEPTVTEDGRRAVQATNGLLTNTVRIHSALLTCTRD